MTAGQLVAGVLLVLWLPGSTPPAHAAARERIRSQQGAEVTAGSKGAVRVFLDCPRGCDDDFLRREIVYVNWVRDPGDADVQVMVTTESTGGGQRFLLRFLGLDRFAGQDLTLEHDESQTDTRDERRRQLARVLQLGLVPYVLDSPQAAGLTVRYEGPAGDQEPLAEVESDPWNYWVFRLGANAALSGEDRRDAQSYSGFANASRTTERWRSSFGLNGSFRQTDFELDDGETFSSINRDLGVGGQVVRGLGEHWGIGLGATERSSTFINLDPSYRVAGALQYNVYPFRQASEQLLTLTYFLGLSRLDYEVTTALGHDQETLADQGVIASYDVRRPWGSSGIDLELSHFLDDTDLYRATLEGELSYRIVRGLSVSLEGSVGLVQDQVYLPAEEATDEDVLVSRRALPTNSRFHVGLGLRYTFGSIYNNVVNSRMRGTSGGFHRLF